MNRFNLSENISKFLKEHGGIEYSPEEIREYLNLNAYVCLYDYEVLTAVLLFSVSGETVTVQELTVHKSWRDRSLINVVAIKVLKKFPWVTHFEFLRLRKYPERGVRKYSVLGMLGVKK